MGIGVVAVNVSTLKKFSASLRELPRVLAHRVAEQAAPALTDAALRTFDAGQNPWGISWDPGVDGQKVTLVKTSALRNTLRYVAIGTRLRVVLAVPYAKYQVGKRPVTPRQGSTLPVEYIKALESAVYTVANAELGKAAANAA